MSMNRPDQSQRNSVLSMIREGMEVYDLERDHIGTVDEVYFGEAGERQQELGIGPATYSDRTDNRDNTIVGAIAQAFDPGEVPDELAEKLQMSGYIRLDRAGLFRGDRYILPEQIAALQGDKVYLSVPSSQLVRRR